jgi:hypothetical protein
MDRKKCPSQLSGKRPRKKSRAFAGLVKRNKRAFASLGFETLEPRMMMTGVVINEILASNSGQYIQDEDGDDSDYIELYNSSESPIDLGGWYLTDNAAQLTKWQLPSVELAVGGYLVIFASNKNRTDPVGELHTNFALSAEGEYLALVHSDGSTVASELAPEYPQQFTDASYGLDGGQELRYFDPPTPGAANGIGLLGFVEAVSVCQSHGFYDAAFELSLQTPTTDAQIYYTFDGSIPAPGNASAVLYQTPIEIDRTTIVRAAGYKADYGLSPVTTQTYIFLEDVLTQTISPTNPSSNPFGLDYADSWQGYPPDFNMDPEVVAEWDDDNPLNDDFGIREGLHSLPTMSLVMDHDDLWDQANGIYPNADEDGELWRRAASIEYFDPATGENFQFNVGAQMQGNSSRNPARTRKHSFRIVFNPEWDGPGRLNFPLFDQSDFADINTVVLKAGNQDSIPTRTLTDRMSPLAATYMRDQWMMNTARDMGQFAEEFTYVHLYINGLYWGLYMAMERPDDAMISARLGGNEEDWDIIEADEITGSDQAWNETIALARSIPNNNSTVADNIYHQLQGLNPDGTRNEALPVYVDMDSLIDYLMVHYYSGAQEWITLNYAYVRNRVDPGTGFRFVLWDQDVTLDGFDINRINNPLTGYSVAQELGYKLRKSPEFRIRFADRLQMHLANGGALTDEANLMRWRALAEQIEPAIIGDSARWGDIREGEVVRIVSGGPLVTIPVITVDLWRDAVETVEGYFAEMRTNLLARLTGNGLYTSLLPPLINQFGGTVANGFEMALEKQAGVPEAATIYYTLDGSDPRLLGNGLNPTAVVYTGPVTLLEDTQLRARVLNGTTWSAEINTAFNVLPPRIPGDFDDNQSVGLEDDEKWTRTFGETVSPGTAADGNRSGVADAADYVIWRKFYVPGPVGPDTDYDFDAIGQTYTQTFDDFRGSEETVPQYFTVTVVAGNDPFRDVFNSTSHTPNMFTGIKAATSDGTDYSLAWRENTGQAGMEDARFLFKIKNDTGQSINGFFVSYEVEAWVNGRRDNQLRFKYDLYADSAESQAAEGRDAFESDIFATLNPNHTVIAANGDQFVLNGKDPANRVTVSGYVDLAALLISDAEPGLGYYGALAPGETAYFRWQISNGLLQDGNRSALGLDNVSITALTGPPSGGSSSGYATIADTAAGSTGIMAQPVGALDEAIAEWPRGMSPSAPVARIRSSIGLPVAPSSSDDVFLQAIQYRAEARTKTNSAAEWDLSQRENREKLYERDELFAEIDWNTLDVFS